MKRNIWVLGIITTIIFISTVEYAFASDYKIEFYQETSNSVRYKVSWTAQEEYTTVHRRVNEDGETIGTPISKSYPSNYYIFQLAKESTSERHYNYHWRTLSEFTDESNKVVTFTFPQTVTSQTIPLKEWHNGYSEPSTDPEDTISNIDHTLNYQSHRDEYRLDWLNLPPDVATFEMKYVSADGNQYDKTWDYTGNDILYLTCNGMYDLYFYDSSGDSYPPEYINDLNIQTFNDGNGTHSLEWDSIPNAIEYEIYKDGQLVGTTNDTQYTTDEEGAYTVRAVDEEGNTLGESDTYIQNGNGEVDGGSDGGCDACSFFEIMQCPQWDEYLGEFEKMIKRAINWNEVAEAMRDAIVPAMTNALVETVVPEIGDEIDRRFGNAEYDGNTGITEPSLSENYRAPEGLPELIDLDQKIDFDLFDENEIPVFEIVDMTPSEEEMIVIPDPIGWENLASSERPFPNDDIGESRDINLEGEGAIGGRSTLPSGNGEAHARDTTPSSGGTIEEDPKSADGKDTTPVDWKNE